jgi:hypothetical protein
LLLLLAACHALGLREHVAALSGTAQAPGAAPPSLALALLYVAVFLGAVVFAPLLGLAAAIFQLLLHLAASAREKPP